MTTTSATIPEDDGVYADIRDTIYHADRGSLSSTGARKLLESPRRFQHAMNQPPETARHFDIGHYVHGKVLGVGSPVVVIDADDFRSKAARDERDQAYADGNVPVLRKDIDGMDAMAEAVLRHPVASLLLEAGTPELSWYWHDETGVRLRARTDWFREYDNGDPPIICDLKTTGTGAGRAAFSATASKGGLYFQDAWYREAIRTAGVHDDPFFVFINVEKDPPYLVSVTQLPARAIELGRRKVRQAVDLYADCTANDHWPAWPDFDSHQIQTVDLAGWLYYQEEM